MLGVGLSLFDRTLVESMDILNTISNDLQQLATAPPQSTNTLNIQLSFLPDGVYYEEIIEHFSGLSGSPGTNARLFPSLYAGLLPAPENHLYAEQLYFTGRQLVHWLIDRQYATSLSEAQCIAQELLDRNYFQPTLPLDPSASHQPSAKLNKPGFSHSPSADFAKSRSKLALPWAKKHEKVQNNSNSPHTSSQHPQTIRFDPQDQEYGLCYPYIPQYPWILRWFEFSPARQLTPITQARTWALTRHYRTPAPSILSIADLYALASNIVHAQPHEIKFLHRPTISNTTLALLANEAIGSLFDSSIMSSPSISMNNTSGIKRNPFQSFRRSMSSSIVQQDSSQADCFTGKNLIQYIKLKRNLYYTIDAITIANQLMSQNLIVHVPSDADLGSSPYVQYSALTSSLRPSPNFTTFYPAFPGEISNSQVLYRVQLVDHEWASIDLTHDTLVLVDPSNSNELIPSNSHPSQLSNSTAPLTNSTSFSQNYTSELRESLLYPQISISAEGGKNDSSLHNSNSNQSYNNNNNNNANINSTNNTNTTTPHLHPNPIHFLQPLNSNASSSTQPSSYPNQPHSTHASNTSTNHSNSNFFNNSHQSPHPFHILTPATMLNLGFNVTSDNNTYNKYLTQRSSTSPHNAPSTAHSSPNSLEITPTTDLLRSDWSLDTVPLWIAELAVPTAALMKLSQDRRIDILRLAHAPTQLDETTSSTILAKSLHIADSHSLIWTCMETFGDNPDYYKQALTLQASLPAHPNPITASMSTAATTSTNTNSTTTNHNALPQPSLSLNSPTPQTTTLHNDNSDDSDDDEGPTTMQLSRTNSYAFASDPLSPPPPPNPPQIHSPPPSDQTYGSHNSSSSASPPFQPLQFPDLSSQQEPPPTRSIDPITCLEFNASGEYLAFGDKVGRITLVQNFHHTLTDPYRNHLNNHLSPNFTTSTNSHSLFGPTNANSPQGSIAQSNFSSLQQHMDSFQSGNPHQSPFRLYHDFVSHTPDVDLLRNSPIEPKINQIRWLPSNPGSKIMSLLTSNDKVVKLWRTTEVDGHIDLNNQYNTSFKPSFSEFVAQRNGLSYQNSHTPSPSLPSQRSINSIFNQQRGASNRTQFGNSINQPSTHSYRSPSILPTKPPSYSPVGILAQINQATFDPTFNRSPYLDNILFTSQHHNALSRSTTSHKITPPFPPTQQSSAAPPIPNSSSTGDIFNHSNPYSSASNRIIPPSSPSPTPPPTFIRSKCLHRYHGHHEFNIHSVSLLSDHEHFISADDMRINLWSLHDPSSTPLTLVDYHTNVVEVDIENLITCVRAHPSDPSAYAIGCSNGFIKLADMRVKAFQDNPKTGPFTVFNNTNANKQYLNSLNQDCRELLSLIHDISFSPDGVYIVSRDFVSVKIWDSRFPTSPLQEYKLHDWCKSSFEQLCELQTIFDPFGTAMSHDCQTIFTGTYYNTFVEINTELPNSATGLPAYVSPTELLQEFESSSFATRQYSNSVTRSRSTSTTSTNSSNPTTTLFHSLSKRGCNNSSGVATTRYNEQRHEQRPLLAQIQDMLDVELLQPQINPTQNQPNLGHNHQHNHHHQQPTPLPLQSMMATSHDFIPSPIQEESSLKLLNSATPPSDEPHRNTFSIASMVSFSESDDDSSDEEAHNFVHGSGQSLVGSKLVDQSAKANDQNNRPISSNALPIFNDIVAGATSDSLPQTNDELSAPPPPTRNSIVKSGLPPKPTPQLTTTPSPQSGNTNNTNNSSKSTMNNSSDSDNSDSEDAPLPPPKLKSVRTSSMHNPLSAAPSCLAKKAGDDDDEAPAPPPPPPKPRMRKPSQMSSTPQMTSTLSIRSTVTTPATSITALSPKPLSANDIPFEQLVPQSTLYKTMHMPMATFISTFPSTNTNLPLTPPMTMFLPVAQQAPTYLIYSPQLRETLIQYLEFALHIPDSKAEALADYYLIHHYLYYPERSPAPPSVLTFNPNLPQLYLGAPNDRYEQIHNQASSPPGLDLRRIPATSTLHQAAALIHPKYRTRFAQALKLHLKPLPPPIDFFQHFSGFTNRTRKVSFDTFSPSVAIAYSQRLQIFQTRSVGSQLLEACPPPPPSSYPYQQTGPTHHPHNQLPHQQYEVHRASISSNNSNKIVFQQSETSSTTPIINRAVSSSHAQTGFLRNTIEHRK